MQLLTIRRILQKLPVLGLSAGMLAGTMLAGGCSTDAGTGLAVGAGLGAIGGAVVGHNTGRHGAEGAAIGAGIGAVTGYIIGNESDKQKMYYSNPNYRY